MKTNKYGDAAVKWLKKHDNGGDYWMVTRGSLNQLHDIYDEAVSNGAKPLREEDDHPRNIHYRVLNNLDRDERFEKDYINYNGIPGRPTRCFTLKEAFR